MTLKKGCGVCSKLTYLRVSELQNRESPSFVGGPFLKGTLAPQFADNVSRANKTFSAPFSSSPAAVSHQLASSVKERKGWKGVCLKTNRIKNLSPGTHRGWSSNLKPTSLNFRHLLDILISVSCAIKSELSQRRVNSLEVALHPSSQSNVLINRLHCTLWYGVDRLGC